MKRIMGDRLTTVFVQQGHYAAEAAGAIMDPAPDLRIEHIGELRDRPLADFVRGAASA
jgi:hypothetical protein